MAISTTGTLTSRQKVEVSLLWNQEYPAQLMLDTVEDFDLYIAGLTDVSHILYTAADHEILGWAFKFTRDSQKWFAIILDSSIHHKGIGSMLLNQLKKNETELNGWVIDHNRYKKCNMDTYQSPLVFYTKNGFRLIEDARIESPNLSAVKIQWKPA